MFGPFDKMFDFNGDGKLGSFEKAAEFATFAHIMGDAEKQNELEQAGLTVDELECMDEDERREALEDAGLDPDDYED